VVELVRLSAAHPSPGTHHDPAKVEVNGRTIPEGQPVVMMWGSGQPRRGGLDHPDEFDIDRDNRKHLCFGFASTGVWARSWPGLISVVLRRVPGEDPRLLS